MDVDVDVDVLQAKKQVRQIPLTDSTFTLNLPSKRPPPRIHEYTGDWRFGGSFAGIDSRRTTTMGIERGGGMRRCAFLASLDMGFFSLSSRGFGIISSSATRQEGTEGRASFELLTSPGS